VQQRSSNLTKYTVSYEVDGGLFTCGRCSHGAKISHASIWPADAVAT
jgi:hypothetical protein